MSQQVLSNEAKANQEDSQARRACGSREEEFWAKGSPGFPHKGEPETQRSPSHEEVIPRKGNKAHKPDGSGQASPEKAGHNKENCSEQEAFGARGRPHSPRRCGKARGYRRAEKNGEFGPHCAHGDSIFPKDHDETSL